MLMDTTRVVVIGSLNMDIVVETEQYPQVGETLMGQRVAFTPGGKGANQAVAAARLGAETTMIGAVGSDAFGEELLRSLQDSGVNVDGVKRLDGVATGTAVISVVSGDNSIIVIPGANYKVKPSDIDIHEDKLRQADIVLLQLEIPVETVSYAAKKAKSLGKTVVLNPAPAQPLPDELIACVDYITPNRTELGRYTEMGTDGEELERAMQAMKAKGAAHVVTTLGDAGSAYLDDDGNLRTIPGYSVEVIDTTGAGDCYNAGLAVSLARGLSLPESIRYATLVSALAVTKFGAQKGMPTKEEASRFAAERQQIGE